MQRALRPDGDRIRTLRIQRNWPQEQLAKIADVSPRTIQRVEAGGNASYETLQSIACAFEIEAKELLTQQPETASLPSQKTTCQEVKIAEPNVAAPLVVANNNRRLKVISHSLWAGLLALAISFLGYLPQFLGRSPDSQGTAVHNDATRRFFSRDVSDWVVGETQPVVSNSSQTPSNISLAAKLLPDLESRVQIRAKIRPIEKRPRRQHRTIQTAESGSFPSQALDTSLPNLATSLLVRLGASESWYAAPQLTGQPGKDLAVTHQTVSSPERDDMRSQTSGGLAARTKKVTGSAYRSASEAAGRFSKRTAGFFSRLGTSLKTSF